MPRRSNGEGTEPKWSEPRACFEGKISLGGKRKTIRGKTRAEYFRNVKAAEAAYVKGLPVNSSKQTFGDYLTNWLELYGSHNWKPGTVGDHAQNLRIHVLPQIGHIPLQKINRDALQGMINTWMDDGCAPSSIRKYLQPVRGALLTAWEDGKIPKNPMQGVKLPKLRKEEITFFTRQEAARYTAHLPDSSNGRLLAFVLRSGLRRGEAIGLQWQDIGEKSFRVQRTVRHTAKKGGGTELYINNDGKTDNSIREIPLNDQLRAILAEQKRHQIAQRLQAGEVWRGDAPGSGGMWVFSNSLGGPADESNVRRAHDATMKKADLDGVDIHGLRHTFATLWVERGGNIKNLSAVLGHADTSITLNRYVHPVREQMQEEMHIMGAIF